ncbi:MAG: LacI family DNA-binding transcriptional regulator [Armatimonadota bacterium]
MPPNKQKSKRITLHDVAAEAGVSIQTVSHVMTGNPTVKLPEATREKVREAAKKVGYTPNRHAQAIRSGKTNVIAIWMPVDRPIVSYMRMLRLVSREAKKTGHELMIVPLDRESGLTEQAVAPNMWPVDGILAMDSGAAVQKYRETAEGKSTPVVVIGYELVENGDAVAWNVAESVQRATKRLVDSGCRKIVYITMDWQERDFPNERRRAGYMAAMLQAGLESSVVVVDEESRIGASRAVNGYITANGVPDAFVGMTDLLAMGAVRAVRAAGKQVPQDCQVMGYGSHPDAEDFEVPISTLRSPIGEVIPRAWEKLNQRIEDPTLSSELETFEMEFIKRDSTR